MFGCLLRQLKPSEFYILSCEKGPRPSALIIFSAKNVELLWVYPILKVGSRIGLPFLWLNYFWIGGNCAAINSQRRSPNTGLMLGHHLRRWPNINPASGKRRMVARTLPLLAH